MTDPHQLNSLIATAICDARKQQAGEGVAQDPEEAKLLAKCIVTALTDAGFQIVPVEKE